MTSRFLIAAGLLTGLGGCAAIPLEAVTAGLGFGTAALTFDDDVLKALAARPAPPAAAKLPAEWSAE